MPTSKDGLIDAFSSDLPDGIKNFLDVTIPTLAATSLPNDVDSSIIVQGILAHNLNTIFKTFEGLSLAAIPMYIGQLNTVNQGMLLAALEYISDSDSVAGDFEIVDPKDGQAYLPGDVRFQVRPKTGELQQVAVEVGDNPVALQYDDSGYFWGFARLEETGSYTASISGLFVSDKGEETTASGSVSFSISPSADAIPEGEDFGPIQYAYDAFTNAAGEFAAAVTDGLEDVLPGLATDAAAFGYKFGAAVEQIAKISPVGLYNSLLELVNDLSSRDISPENTILIELMGNVERELTTVYSESTINYRNNNPHPPTGYASCPEVLKGAAAAMNEMYGAGTVWYEGM